MINEAFFLGRFVREPKLSSKEKEDGTLYWARFRIAVNRNYAKDGEADYFNCVAYHAKAKHLVKYGKQGGRVFVKGRLRSGAYEKDGKKSYYDELVVTDCQVIDFKERPGGQYPKEEAVRHQEEDFYQAKEERIPFPEEERYSDYDLGDGFSYS